MAKLKEKLDGPPRWQLEVRSEPKDAVPVSDIADFATCFDGIRFLHLPHDAAPFNTPEGYLFIACARRKSAPPFYAWAGHVAGYGLVQRRLAARLHRAGH
ncbi:hypothetical protein EHZ25_00700 [Paraburkholderia tropica]|nr:hypothetical protein EHZ25_00700 [Paraburkholderia tropica]